MGTAKPVNFLLEGGQEVEEINAIESSRRMRGRDGSGGQGGGGVDWKRVSWVTINQQDKKATGAFD